MGGGRAPRGRGLSWPGRRRGREDSARLVVSVSCLALPCVGRVALREACKGVTPVRTSAPRSFVADALCRLSSTRRFVVCRSGFRSSAMQLVL